MTASKQKTSTEQSHSRADTNDDHSTSVQKRPTSSAEAGHSITGPTYLTIARMILAVLFMFFALLPDTWCKVLAFIIFIIASLTDLIDGKWARRQKIVTDLGAFLDPLADKMLTGLAFLVLVYLNIVPIWVFAIILVRDFAVDGMRMMAARSGKTIAASIYGKWKTTFQMTALSIILLNLTANLELFTILGNFFLYLSLILTIFSGADYLVKGYREVIK